MITTTQVLPAGQVLTVTADAGSSGSVIRLQDAAGGDPFAPIPVVAGASVVVGPFSNTRRYAVDTASGNALGYSIAAAAASPQSDTVNTLSADGAIPIVTGTYKITKAGVAALTLAAPRADQEGTRLTVVGQTANAHTITATGLLDDGVTGGSKNTALFAAFVGATIVLEAVGLKWSVVSLKAVTVS